MVRVLIAPAPAARLAAALMLAMFAGIRSPAWAADAKKGADSFDENCSECHSVAKTLRSKKGPSLYGVIGRNAASIEGFGYSDAIRQRPIVWSRDNLDAYIAAPKKFVPGGKMKFDGIDDAAERADLIEFLAHPPE
jgi:cytochrome c